jgi:hypothetical protein
MLSLPRWARRQAGHGSVRRRLTSLSQQATSEAGDMPAARFTRTPNARLARTPASRVAPVVPVIALAGLAVLATGCGSGAQPRTLPSITTAPTTPASASPSDSPSPSPSATSSAAVKKQLKAVVRQYVHVVNSQKQHMDADALAALLTKDCLCQKQVKAIRKVKSDGNHYTQQYKVLNLAPAVTDSSEGTVLAQISVSAGGIVDANGHYVRRTKAVPPYQENFRLAKHEKRWLIHAIEDTGPVKQP